MNEWKNENYFFKFKHALEKNICKFLVLCYIMYYVYYSVTNFNELYFHYYFRTVSARKLGQEPIMNVMKIVLSEFVYPFYELQNNVM